MLLLLLLMFLLLTYHDPGGEIVACVGRRSWKSTVAAAATPAVY